MENYDIIGVVGEGTYGVVHKAKHKSSGLLVAIKQFKECDEHEQIRKTAIREIRILKQLVHDNIVALYDVFREKGRLFLVFEYIERSLLSDLEACPTGLDKTFVRPLMYQLLQSLSFIHSHNIIHRDVKPENILLTQHGVVKLCDFGFARALSVFPGTRYTDYVATRWYRAPELLVGQTDYDCAVDVWAVGCLLCELMTGQPLFPGDSDIDQLHHIMCCLGPLPNHLVEIFYRNQLYRGAQLPRPAKVEPLHRRYPFLSKNTLSLISACLRYDPKERPSATKLLNHPFFSAGFVEHFTHEYTAVIRRDREQRNRCFSLCNMEACNATVQSLSKTIMTDKASFERSLPTGPTFVGESMALPALQGASAATPQVLPTPTPAPTVEVGHVPVPSVIRAAVPAGSPVRTSRPPSRAHEVAEPVLSQSLSQLSLNGQHAAVLSPTANVNAGQPMPAATASQLMSQPLGHTSSSSSLTQLMGGHVNVNVAAGAGVGTLSRVATMTMGSTRHKDKENMELARTTSNTLKFKEGHPQGHTLQFSQSTSTLDIEAGRSHATLAALRAKEPSEVDLARTQSNRLKRMQAGQVYRDIQDTAAAPGGGPAGGEVPQQYRQLVQQYQPAPQVNHYYQDMYQPLAQGHPPHPHQQHMGAPPQAPRATGLARTLTQPVQNSHARRGNGANVPGAPFPVVNGVGLTPNSNGNGRAILAPGVSLSNEQRLLYTQRLQTQGAARNKSKSKERQGNSKERQSNGGDGAAGAGQLWAAGRTVHRLNTATVNGTPVGESPHAHAHTHANSNGNSNTQNLRRSQVVYAQQSTGLLASNIGIGEGIANLRLSQSSSPNGQSEVSEHILGEDSQYSDESPRVAAAFHAAHARHGTNAQFELRPYDGAEGAVGTSGRGGSGGGGADAYDDDFDTAVM